MTTAQLAPKSSGLAATIAAMTTKQLREELAKGLRVTAENLLKVALIAKTLEDRGEDLSALRMGILPYLRQIAAGVLLPEIVVRFAGVPSLISRIAKMPLDEQQRLAEGRMIDVLKVEPDGESKVVAKNPVALTKTEAEQVFSEGRILSEQEQREAVKPEKNRVGRRPSLGACGPKTDSEAMDDVFAFAKSASAGDLAERLADVIAKHPEPKQVMARIEREVERRVKNGKRFDFSVED